MSDLDGADEEYERAEAAFLDAVRSGHGDPDLLSRAEGVAATAETWNAVAYQALHERRSEAAEAQRELDSLTERTEVLSELWRDIAAAFRRRAEGSTWRNAATQWVRRSRCGDLHRIDPPALH